MSISLSACSTALQLLMVLQNTRVLGFGFPFLSAWLSAASFPFRSSRRTSNLSRPFVSTKSCLTDDTPRCNPGTSANLIDGSLSASRSFLAAAVSVAVDRISWRSSRSTTLFAPAPFSLSGAPALDGLPSPSPRGTQRGCTSCITSLPKPCSIIVSTSSTTRLRTDPIAMFPFIQCRRTLEGVPTTTSTCLCSSFLCFPMSSPPIRDAQESLSGPLQSAFATSKTCCASSRVGARTIIRGCRGRLRKPLFFSSSLSVWKRGRRKAKVLPDPVWAAKASPCPPPSLPVSPSLSSRLFPFPPERSKGTASLWTSVGTL
mmetsp:Transcript_9643/g.18750  ORF Transcript_9643/g.18750 Transcript_9643/m.18750 type:complete len:316 (-) Transcript_9643:1077-2024(-)